MQRVLFNGSTSPVLSSRSARWLRLGCTIIFTLMISSSSLAHFVWIYAEGDQVRIAFSEDPDFDQADFLDGLDRMKVYRVAGDQAEILKFTRQTDDEFGWFEIPRSEAGDVVVLNCPYGVISRAGTALQLDYNARYIRWNPELTCQVSEELNLDVIPSLGDNGQLQLTVYFQGQPVEGAELVAYRERSAQREIETAPGGHAQIALSSRYVIRAKHTLAEAGSTSGQVYDEQRFYCTLVLDLPQSVTAEVVTLGRGHSSSADSNRTPQAAAANKGHQIPRENDDAQAPDKVEPVDVTLPEMPVGLTSFGAAVRDGQVFVVGGKQGRAHDYAASYQNRDIFRLDLNATDPDWDSIGQSLPLQGLALVGLGDKLYRIGGMQARNAEGEEHDLHSVTEFAAFDLKKQAWTELPDLPEGRSSFDACLVGRTIYVVGGWELKGDEESRWYSDGLMFDLEKPEQGWKKFDVPFQARALCVRAVGDQLFAMGGIEPGGGTTNAVHVLDTNTQTWSAGPDLPTEGNMKAFGCSAAVVDNRLLVSTYDGGVYLLDQQTEHWAKVYQLDPGRFFHQMLPLGDSKFALVGGAHMEIGKIHELDVFRLHASGN